ncbi:MAG: hypothetical protein OEY89_12510, partial [Gammaproteobacteria bacterium]|nr:hypothetical protein [Gammaproteobacteria bacterium]
DDLEEWSKFIGDWITELSFLSITKDGANRLKDWIKQLCLLEPALYCSSGRAISVLDSLTD